MKRELCWIGLLTVFGATILLAPGIFNWPALGGFGSLVTNIFLAYCAIILVAQVFSAIQALRSLAKDAAQRRTLLQDLPCRTEQTTSGQED